MSIWGAATRQGQYVHVYCSVCGGHLCFQICHKATASICSSVSGQPNPRAMNSNSLLEALPPGPLATFVTWPRLSYELRLSLEGKWKPTVMLLVCLWGWGGERIWVNIYNLQGAFWKPEPFENGREGWRLKPGGRERFSSVEFHLISSGKMDCRSPHRRPQRQKDQDLPYGTSEPEAAAQSLTYIKLAVRRLSMAKYSWCQTCC